MTKNDSAAIRSGTAALRREFDRLDNKMKEDIGNLKHECVIGRDCILCPKLTAPPGSRWSLKLARMKREQS